MNETITVLMPYMIRAKVPVVRDLHELNPEQMVSVMQKMARDPMNLESMNHVELVNLLNRLRCEYCELLSSEPDEDSLLSHCQWRDDMARLKSRISSIQERLAA